jgi:hypothetical protein
MLVPILLLIVVLALQNKVSESMSTGEVKAVQFGVAPMTLSLWLIPPVTSKDKIKRQFDKLAANRGPSFDPHVTIIGGIQCQSESHAQEMVKTLQEGLKGFGPVPVGSSARAFTSKGVWSQALFLTVESSAPMMNLCVQSRALLGMDTEKWRFAPPVNMPHLSLFYGEEANIPDKNEVVPIPSFHSSTLALWSTDPPTLEGVPKWKEIAVIDIQ